MLETVLCCVKLCCCVQHVWFIPAWIEGCQYDWHSLLIMCKVWSNLSLIHIAVLLATQLKSTCVLIQLKPGLT